MKQIVIYERSTGRILKSVQCLAGDVVGQFDAAIHAHIEHPQVDDTANWIDGGVVLPFIPITPVVNGTTLTGLPSPITLIVDGEEHVVTGGVAELEFGHPGTYTVQLTGFPYVETSVEVTQP